MSSYRMSIDCKDPIYIMFLEVAHFATVNATRRNSAVLDCNLSVALDLDGMAFRSVVPNVQLPASFAPGGTGGCPRRTEGQSTARQLCDLGCVGRQSQGHQGTA